MTFPIDHVLYPDAPVPESLPMLADRVDYLVRLCAAWDFGRLPDPDAVEAIRDPDWMEAVGATRLLTSPAYHLLRRWHRLLPLPYLGMRIPQIADDPSLRYV